MADQNIEFYANGVNVITSSYDVTLNFRTETPLLLPEGKKPILEVVSACNVRMSPQHAKALAALLAKQITDYEENNKVELAIPSDVKEYWNKYVKGEAKKK